MGLLAPLNINFDYKPSFTLYHMLYGNNLIQASNATSGTLFLKATASDERIFLITHSTYNNEENFMTLGKYCIMTKLNKGENVSYMQSTIAMDENGKGHYLVEVIVDLIRYVLYINSYKGIVSVNPRITDSKGGDIPFWKVYDKGGLYYTNHYATYLDKFTVHVSDGPSTLAYGSYVYQNVNMGIYNSSTYYDTYAYSTYTYVPNNP